MNKIAPQGQVYVCTACGKKSRDLYGDNPLNYGWDASCVLNAVLCYENKLVLQNERVVKVEEGGLIKGD